MVNRKVRSDFEFDFDSVCSNLIWMMGFSLWFMCTHLSLFFILFPSKSAILSSSLSVYPSNWFLSLSFPPRSIDNRITSILMFAFFVSLLRWKELIFSSIYRMWLESVCVRARTHIPYNVCSFIAIKFLGQATSEARIASREFRWASKTCSNKSVRMRENTEKSSKTHAELKRKNQQQSLASYFVLLAFYCSFFLLGVLFSSSTFMFDLISFYIFGPSFSVANENMYYDWALDHQPGSVRQRSIRTSFLFVVLFIHSFVCSSVIQQKIGFDSECVRLRRWTTVRPNRIELQSNWFWLM